jgi:hypothetical protein
MMRTSRIGKRRISLSPPGGETRARRADRAQGSWINYQMKLSGVTQKLVATMAGVSRQMVQRVAYGVSTSAKVQRAIAQALGYKTWSELVAARQGVAA